MYAQLGTTIFDNLKGFTDYSKSGEATYAQHDVITGKPLLEATGLNLDEITLSIRLHVSFCKPAEELASLKSQRDSLAPLSLIWGNGKVEGKFVITSLSERVEDADAQGNVFSYTIDLTLREYIETDPLRAAKIQSVKNALAVGDKKPVAKKKINDPTCPQKISKLVTSIDNHAKQINAIILENGGANLLFNRTKISRHLNAIWLLDEDLMMNCRDPQSCASSYPDILYQAQQVYNSYRNFDNLISAPGSYLGDQIPNQNKVLQATVRNLKAVSFPLIKKSIVNNG